MKSKNKPAPLLQKSQDDNQDKDERQIAWRSIGIRLAAIVMIIIFLVGECAPLFAGE